MTAANLKPQAWTVLPTTALSRSSSRPGVTGYGVANSRTARHNGGVSSARYCNSSSRADTHCGDCWTTWSGTSKGVSGEGPLSCTRTAAHSPSGDGTSATETDCTHRAVRACGQESDLNNAGAGCRYGRNNCNGGPLNSSETSGLWSSNSALRSPKGFVDSCSGGIPPPADCGDASGTGRGTRD